MNYIQRIRKGVYIIDGLTKLGLVNDILGTSLESEHYETIGGLLIGAIGRFPKKGEIIELAGLKCKVLDFERNRIKRIRLKLDNQ